MKLFLKKEKNEDRNDYINNKQTKKTFIQYEKYVETICTPTQGQAVQQS